MARIKGAMMTRKRRKKILGLAKGYWGSKSKHFKMANQAVTYQAYNSNYQLCSHHPMNDTISSCYCFRS